MVETPIRTEAEGRHGIHLRRRFCGGKFIHASTQRCGSCEPRRCHCRIFQVSRSPFVHEYTNPRDSYRLSILGFPGNPTAQNNVAFLDQRLAMEWVHENIANFGGDPARITLFGQSAGAASADYYSYAWTSNPIAAGIILQSGTAFSFGLPYSKNVSAVNWYDVATTLGCGNASTDSTTLLACMCKVEVDSLLSAVPRTGIYSITSAFSPTVDNTLVFANYSEQTPASIPVLVGSNDYEPGQFRTE